MERLLTRAAAFRVQVAMVVSGWALYSSWRSQAVGSWWPDQALCPRESPRLVRALSERPRTRHVQPRLSWGCLNAIKRDRPPCRARQPLSVKGKDPKPGVFCCDVPGPPGKSKLSSWPRAWPNRALDRGAGSPWLPQWRPHGKGRCQASAPARHACTGSGQGNTTGIACTCGSSRTLPGTRFRATPAVPGTGRVAHHKFAVARRTGKLARPRGSELPRR